MTHPNRYILAVFGESRDSVSQRIPNLLSESYVQHNDSYADIFRVGDDTALVKDSYTHYNGVSLVIHGVVFFNGSESGPSTILMRELDKSNQSRDLRHLPLAIDNGSYVAVCSDPTQKAAYAFTSFLNSVPLYYTSIDNCLVLSSNLSVLRRLHKQEMDHLDHGVREYYALGTILSCDTGIKGIQSIPKGACLRYSEGRIEQGYYYTMPAQEEGPSLSAWVDVFAEKWDHTIGLIQSTSHKYGLGLTGGVDSRLILAGMKDRLTPLFFTGSNPDHPDWLLSNHITRRLGINNHVLEDYTHSDKLRGYASYCALPDNPLNLNHMYYMDKLMFRVQNGLAFELIGLTEFLGGVYHYRDRRSVIDTLKMSGPLKKHPLNRDIESIARLMILGLRNQILDRDISDITGEKWSLQTKLVEIASVIIPQLGELVDEESFLERFRHVHKMANLLTWSHLANRRYLECFSPSMNIGLTDLACRIPLRYRDSRRLLFAYLKKYHPELAMFPLTGYGFTPNDPWIMFKLLGPQIKVLNHLGLKIPGKQWYLRKGSFQDIESMPEVYEFQKRVCHRSLFLNETGLGAVLRRFPSDNLRLMRCFNIALLELSGSLNDQAMSRYLLDQMEEVIQTKNPQKTNT